MLTTKPTVENYLEKFKIILHKYISLKSILNLSPHLLLGLPRDFFERSFMSDLISDLQFYVIPQSMTSRFITTLKT